MEKTRLIQLFRTFSNKEIRELRKFLHSPFFNTREEVTQLFEYLVETLTVLNTIPSKEKAYQFVTGNKTKAAFDDQQVRLWMSFLFKNMEKFLVHCSFFEDEVKIKTQLATLYRQRHLPRHQERTLREVKASQAKRAIRNAEFYSDDFQIQLEEYRFISAVQRMGEFNLQQLSDYLDLAYLAQKLRQSCWLLSHQTVYKTQYRFGLMSQILEYIEQEDLLEIPAIAVYYYCYQTLTQPKESRFFRAFKNAIVAKGALFPRDELGDLYILAINFCIKRYNEGNPEYLKDEFELYNGGLKNGLFLYNNVMSRFTYWNAVTVALVMKEFDWVEQFIHEYRNALDKAFQESMFNINLVRLEYTRKNYKVALQLLLKSEYKDLLLNLAAKTVQLKIYYELEEYDLLDAHLSAMRTYIRRKKIIGYHKENYVNLIHFTRKMMERNPYDKREQQQLLEEIEQTQAIAEKKWLVASLALPLQSM